MDAYQQIPVDGILLLRIEDSASNHIISLSIPKALVPTWPTFSNYVLQYTIEESAEASFAVAFNAGYYEIPPESWDLHLHAIQQVTTKIYRAQKVELEFDIGQGPQRRPLKVPGIIPIPRLVSIIRDELLAFSPHFHRDFAFPMILSIHNGVHWVPLPRQGMLMQVAYHWLEDLPESTEEEKAAKTLARQHNAGMLHQYGTLYLKVELGERV